MGDAEAAGRPAAGWGERGRRGVLELGGRGEGVLLLGLRCCGSVHGVWGGGFGATEW